VKLQRLDKVLRRLMLDQIEEAACIAEDCARLVADAACRIDMQTLAVRLIQLRLCCIAMTRSYDDVVKLMERSDGQGMAGEEPAHDRRADLRSSDAVA
jgi:hypothetical protein